MNRRSRSLAGILMLAATILSFGETVLASVCAPMTGMGGGDMATEMASAPVGSADRGAMDFLLDPGRGGHGAASDSHCPLNPAVGSGCSAVASLPASAAAASAATDRASHAPAFDDIGSDLLLAHALFHPPRA